jgi:Zn-dependent alcohol dehydrogenase
MTSPLGVAGSASLIGGRTLRGVMERVFTPADFIPRRAALNAEGKLPYDGLITTFPIDQIRSRWRTLTSKSTTIRLLTLLPCLRVGKVLT